ncbi:MAG: hypothetical protein N3D14_05825 [Aquificaceae bacterium]|nr:hypothetical protein [Aquificaceae bacterium]
MVTEAIKLLFLIVSYNFILNYLSGFSPIPFFPKAGEDVLMLFSYSSVLYLAWLFGYREKTVIWLAYVYFLQVVGLSFLRSDYSVLVQFTPSILLTLFLIWLFESPVEKRTRRLEEERKKLEEELSQNVKEINGLIEQMNLLRQLTDGLNKEKDILEREYRKLKEEELTEKKKLEQEREELNRRLTESQKRIQEYTERLERLTKINRELFEMLEALQEKNPKGNGDELSRLRQERKRLSKELVQLYEFLEDLSKENKRLSETNENLKQTLERERKEKELLSVEVENLKMQWGGKREAYREVFEALLENLEFEERVIREFLSLSKEAKREFVKELFLLNVKTHEDRFESMKGYRNVFKLKPMGGRIYFTFGESKRWRVLGMLWGEDNRLKDRYAKELLIKYKD